LLIGAQLAFYVQYPQYLQHGQQLIELNGSARESAGLSVMYLIGRDYGAGKHDWTSSRLAAELDIPSTALAPVLASLEKVGLIVATEAEQFLPGRDLEGIALVAVLDAVRTPPAGRHTVAVRPIAPVVAVMQEVEGAMRGKLVELSLKDLIAAA
jgi:membrane protein